MPRALYHRRGLEPASDPYEPPALRKALEDAGVIWRPGGRKIVKDIFNMLVNAKSRRGLHTTNPARALPSSIEFEWACEQIMKHNEQIRSAMGTQAGLDLMKRESDLCLQLLQSARSAGVPVLPIHDGFRVQVDHAEWLEREMARLYEVHFGHAALVK